MKIRYIIDRGGWMVSILLFLVWVVGCYIGTTTFFGMILAEDTLSPISGAYLLFSQRVTYSGEDGHFFFSSVPYGNHVLSIHVPFYKDIDYLVNIDKPNYALSSPIYLTPFKWEEKEDYYIYTKDDEFKIFSSLDGVNFSEEKVLKWGGDLIGKMADLIGEESIIPFSVFTCWPKDEVSMEEIMAFTVYTKGEIHILDETVKEEDEDLQREIFAHEFTHLFLYRYAHIVEPFIQEGMAFYFPSFILGYGEKYDYKYYKSNLIHYLIPSHIPTWKEAGEIYSKPEDTKIFWFSVYEVRSIFYFLAQRYGKEKVIALFKGLKGIGGNFDNLFLEVFGKHISELEEEWKRYFSLSKGERDEGYISHPTYIY